MTGLIQPGVYVREYDFVREYDLNFLTPTTVEELIIADNMAQQMRYEIDQEILSRLYEAAGKPKKKKSDLEDWLERIGYEE